MYFVHAVPESGCWIWMGSLSNAGYGFFKDQVKLGSAHRASYRMFRGEIPENLMVLHTCDVKCCVNPNHLYLGDGAQNSKDAIERGQKPTGDKHWRRKLPDRQRGNDAPHRTLTEDQVREIRASGNSQSAMARQYGVSVQQIHRIVHRQSWQHI